MCCCCCCDGEKNLNSDSQKTLTMKLSAALALTLTAVGGTAAFQATPIFPRTVSSQSCALSMGGFLEGKGKKITVREDEDAAMWFDDGSGGRVPSEKPKTNKPVKQEPKKSSGGFKFPWDK